MTLYYKLFLQILYVEVWAYVQSQDMSTASSGHISPLKEGRIKTFTHFRMCNWYLGKSGEDVPHSGRPAEWIQNKGGAESAND